MEDFWVDLVLRLGFPVVVVLCMIKGYLVPGFIYDRVIKENDRLTSLTEEKVIPALIEYNRTIERVLDKLDAEPPRARTRRSSP